MGQKFCNLNVFGAALENVVQAAPQYRSVSLAPSWVTVVSQDFSWGNTQNSAKALSKALSAPVLSTEYFDDDYVEFALYQSGKLVTRHIPTTYEDLRRKRGSTSAFLSTLKLNLLEEPALKRAFALEDPEEVTCLLESFLGCPIFGVDGDCLPDQVPGRETWLQFSGGQSAFTVQLQKNPAKKDREPYLFNDEGTPRPKGICRTICCYTDQPEQVIKKIEHWMELFRKDRTGGKDTAMEQVARQLEARGNPAADQAAAELREKIQRIRAKDHWTEFNIRVLIRPGVTAVQGVLFGDAGACAPDFSRDFKCLVAVCSVNNYHHMGAEHRNMDCAFAYGKKLLAFGYRGWPMDMAKKNQVIPDLTLDCPQLKLAPGQLTQAFERPAFFDAVDAMEGLLRCPLSPIRAQDHSLIREEFMGHLKIYKDQI